MHLMLLRHRETAPAGGLLGCIAGILHSHSPMGAQSPELRDTTPTERLRCKYIYGRATIIDQYKKVVTQIVPTEVTSLHISAALPLDVYRVQESHVPLKVDKHIKNKY